MTKDKRTTSAIGTLVNQLISRMIMVETNNSSNSYYYGYIVSLSIQFLGDLKRLVAFGC